MNIEKTECDKLGYEYKNLLEQVVYALHHIPYAKDFISEEKLKKLDDLSLKLSTGNCEIIEFKRTLCKYNFTDILKEKDSEIEQLRTELNSKDNIINELDKDIYSLYEDICNSDNTYCYRIPMEIIIDRMEIIIDKLNKMSNKITKFNENK